MACWSTKAAISLKRVKIVEDHGGPIGTDQCSFERYHPRPPAASCSPIQTGFKFGRYIQRVHPNKIPLKSLEKRERGRIQGLPKVFKYPLLSQERAKLRTSNFVRIFIGSIGTNPHLKFGEVAAGVLRDSRKFSGHPHIGRIARPSLR